MTPRICTTQAFILCQPLLGQAKKPNGREGKTAWPPNQKLTGELPQALAGLYTMRELVAVSRSFQSCSPLQEKCNVQKPHKES